MNSNLGHGNSGTSEVEKIVQAVAHGELTRRQFIERGIALGLSVSALATVLGACGDEGTTETETPTAMDTTLPEELHLYNYSDYMSPQCLEDFEAQYGVKVVESYYDTASALFSKLRVGGEGYDVAIPTDPWISIMSKSGLLHALNLEYIPNFKYVTDPVFQKPEFDNPDEQDGKKYSVPYTFGTNGYAATLAKVPSPMDSWDQLWDETHSGEISMLGERNAMAVGLIKLGYSPNTTSQDELDAATEVLIEQKPLVQKYDSVNTRRSIVQGLALTHCWDGDVGLAVKTIPVDSVDYVLPSQGYVVWADSLVVPTGCNSVYAAHLFLNHMLDPKQAGQAADYIGYQCVVSEGVQYYTDPNQVAMRATPEEIASGLFIQDMGEFQTQYDEAWRKVVSA